MEVWRLVGNPSDELCNRFARTDSMSIVANAGQFGVGESDMDGLVADRVDRHRSPPLLRFWHRVMPLNLAAQRTFTQPTRERLVAQLFFSAAFLFIVS